MCDDNRKKSVAILYNVILAPDLCDRLFSIVALINAGHTCIFHQGFCTVYLGAKEDIAVTLSHSAQRKHAFTGKFRMCQRKLNFQQEIKLL